MEADSHLPASRVLRAVERLLFCLLVLLQTVPVWGVKYFPSQDGVAHVENAAILRQWLGFGGDLFRRYYELNPFPEPNWTGHVLLIFLTAVLSPANALKALVVLFVVAFPLCVRYAAGGVRAGGAALAGWMSLPFVFMLPLLKGNFNYCIGLLLFFIVVGYWVRNRRRVTVGVAARLGGLLLLLYFSHVVPLAIAVLAIGAIEVANWRVEGGAFGGKLMTALALAPAGILAGAFLIWHHGAPTERLPAEVLLRQFDRLSALVGDSKAQEWLAICVVALFAVIAASMIVRMARGGRSPWDVLAVLALIATGIYFAAPNSAAGGGQINLRLALFPFFFLLLWFVCRPLPRVFSGAAMLLAAMLGFALGAVQHHSALQISRYVDDFVSVESHIPRGSTIAAVMSSWDDYLPDGRPFTHKLRPLLSAAGYVAADTGSVDLTNYEAVENYFPLRWRAGVRPVPTDADYVVVWQTGGIDADSMLKQIAPILARDYGRVYVSPRGWATLYRRKSAVSR
jgi:hypothetical protein